MEVIYQHMTNTHRCTNCGHSCLWASNVWLIDTVQQATVIYNLRFHNLCSKCLPLAFTHALSATRWWQSRCQTGPAAFILQLRLLATHQHLGSSFCNSFCITANILYIHLYSRFI